MSSAESSTDSNNSSPATSSNSTSLSKSAITAIAASLSGAVIVILLTLLYYLHRRRALRRASLSSIGAANLYDTPKSARSSQIVVTREISRSVSHLPVNQQNHVRVSYGSTHSRKKLLRWSQGSTRSNANSLRPSAYASSTRSRSSAPPRPTRPSWQANVLSAEASNSLSSHISATPPPRSYSPLALSSLTASTSKPLPPPPPIFTGERGSGQVVHTFRHPTPTAKEKDFATQRAMVQVERSLGANEGMSEVGFKREVYTMYDPSEELGRERWRNIAKGVQLDKDGAEIVEWTQRCTSGVSAVSTVGRGSAMSVVSDEDVGIAL